ncbi:MAG TPA: hypothetical protein VGS08_00145 [Candidatus Saccharimonadales bacterium]|nr:hypothetical protein [Candidatus Saccharimonadales bacterium]
MGKRRITDILGWYGAVAILLAYELVSFKVTPAHSFVYQILNLTGALGIVTVALTKKDAQPAVLNMAWAVIALIGLLIG